MTGDRAMFSTLKSKDGGHVSFGDNSKGNIIDEGSIGKTSSPIIENVLLVEGLKHNLLSISQMCDKDNHVTFEKSHYTIKNSAKNKVLFVGYRHENVYIFDLHSLSPNHDIKCLSAMNKSGWLWHRRLGHAHMDLLSKLSKLDLVVGLPKIDFEKDRLCDACQQGKQSRVSFKSKNIIFTSRPLQLLHIDLFGPSRTLSLGSKSY